MKQKGYTWYARFHKNHDELFVEHEWLSLPDSCRGQGLGRKITATFLDQYEQIGVKRIELYAALTNGGAVWAKFGFKATRRSEMERILLFAEQQMGGESKFWKLVQNTFEAYYGKEPEGEAFPIRSWVHIPGMEQILNGANGHWHGRLDLTNQLDLRNFRSYVGKKQ